MNEKESSLRTIFLEAVEIIDDAERAAYLQRICGGDASLHQRLEKLLKAHTDAGGFASVAGGASMIAPVTEKPGDHIGRYKLREQIGEGGCGVVYVAEQEEPVRRRVALKVIKLGMDTKQVVARFEAERQALAMMDHPNIAKVLDAGATDAGRPYFVMELVRGTRITDYCDQNTLSTKERLDLFIQVCRAIQHAHQKGIIHRDIKPSNILVTTDDPDKIGMPKVIDFGIAKATEGRLTDLTVYTELHQFIGTPAYMSPEQAGMSPDSSGDIDTRSDIYSLGVLLYELLTGWTPFEAKALLKAGLDEMRRVIREEDPPKPSTRLSESKDALPSIAANRHTEPARLTKEVCGELDWIVMKCLEKDRNRRYETTNGLAADIRRYLADETVQARPSTQLYRINKFIRRNKVGVVAGSAVAMALAAGLTLASIGFVQARRQARIAAAEATRALEAKGSTEAALAEKSLALQEKAGALQLAEEKEQLQRRRFYASQMNLAAQALATGDPARVLDILDQQRPLAGEPDLRGFEWYYLWREIHPGLRQTVVCPGNIGHWALAVSPDGKTVAINDHSVEQGHQVKLFDAGSGVLKGAISGLPTEIASLTFSPDGSSLAGGAFDQFLYVWSIPSGRQIARTMVPGWIVRTCGFSPDGKRLVAGADALKGAVSGAIRIYDAESLEVVANLKPNSADAPASDAFYSPDGTKVITSAAWGREGVITRIHDVTKQPPEVIAELNDFRATDISPDGRLLVGAWQRGLCVRDFAERRIVWQKSEAHPGNIADVKFTRDGASLASAGGDDRLVIVWNLADHKEVLRLPHPDQLQRVAFARSDRGIWASLSDDGTAKVWDLKPRPKHDFIGKVRYVESIIALPDGRSIMVGGQFPAEIWDLKSETQSNDPSSATHARGISADGRWLASVQGLDPGAGIGVSVRDRTTGQIRHSIPMPDNKQPQLVRISPNGRFLAARGLPTESALLWDLSRTPGEVPTPVPVRFLSQPNVCGAMDFVFSPDSRWLAFAYQFGHVSLYDTESNRNVPLPLSNDASWATRVAFSRDGKLLAAGDDAGRASVLDLEAGEVIASLAGHEASVTALAFFPDGKTLAVGSLGTIRLWDVDSNQERITLRLAPDPQSPQPALVEEVVVTQDGRTLVSRHANGTVKIWNSADELADVATKPRAQFRRPAAAKDDPRVYVRRAIFHASIGNWDSALADWRHAREVSGEGDASEHPDMANTLHKLGDVLRDAGQWAQAEEAFRQTVALRRRLFGNEHLDLAHSLHALAWVLNHNGKRAEAEAASREELALRRKLLGNDHAEVAFTLEDLSVFLRDQGKLAEAETTAREALAMRRKLLGSEHRDLDDSLGNLARVLRDQGKLIEAEAVQREELAVEQKLSGPEHPFVANSLDSLAGHLREQGKLVEAESVIRGGLAMRRKLQGNDDPALAATLAELTNILLAQEKSADAEPLARECLAIREKQLPDDWRTFNARALLGRALLGQKQYAEAEPLLLAGYEGMKQREDRIPAIGKGRLKETIQSLARLYKATSRPALAAEWEKKLAESGKAETDPKAVIAKP